MHKNIRYISQLIKDDLSDKMVFVGGPRQVGKTTLAKNIEISNKTYLNYDSLVDKKIILRGELYPNYSGLIILDEIHKYRLWRNLVKGEFDKHFPSINFLITGSARLDYFRKGGDSLVGRYHYYRLHPLSLVELDETLSQSSLQDLMKFGGFPEPCLKGDSRFLKRWQLERMDRVIQQDVRDLALVKEISNLSLLAEILPSKVGSLLSVKSIAEDLMISPHTVNNYLDLFENLYISYRISPYGSDRVKAVKKAPKIFLWDWSLIEEVGHKFENMVASHLLKYCHFHTDFAGEKMELRFIRDVDGKEVDFIVLKNKKPLFIVECKTGSKQLSPHLSYFQTKYNIPKAYQVHYGPSDLKKGNPEKGGMILSFGDFCKEEELK